MHLQHVGCETFGARGLVLAQSASERLQMSVQVSLQAPVVHAAPGTVAASVPESAEREAT